MLCEQVEPGWTNVLARIKEETWRFEKRKKKKSYDNAVIMEGIASLVLARE